MIIDFRWGNAAPRERARERRDGLGRGDSFRGPEMFFFKEVPKYDISSNLAIFFKSTLVICTLVVPTTSKKMAPFNDLERRRKCN